MNNQGKIICKTCQKPTTIPLKTAQDIAEFKNYKKGFACGTCAIKFWDEKIKNGEIILQRKSKDFQEQYWAEKNKQNEQH